MTVSLSVNVLHYGMCDHVIVVVHAVMLCH